MAAQIKPMHSRSQQGANRSIAGSYGEDLQRCCEREGAVLCAGIYATRH